MRYLLIWFGLTCAIALCQPSNRNECASYTINHNYPETVSNDQIQTLKGKQGHPGKRGPKGDKGKIGRKGKRGISLTLSDIPKSCAHVQNAHTGVYLISPNLDLVQPFYVFCNFSNPREPVTEVGNNYVNEVAVIRRCQNPKCAHEIVEHSATLQQITALINISSTCRQFIKVRCDASFLFKYNDNQFHAAWISRHEKDMHYWGGATSQRDWYCACGEKGSCVDPTKKCNCDKNSSPETSDEGYITDKNNLPVMGFKHGDTDDDSEFAWHTLGRLKCSGIA